MYLPEGRCCMKLEEPQNKLPIIHTYYIILRGGSRAAAASKTLHLGCCSSSRSASDTVKYYTINSSVWRTMLQLKSALKY